MKKAVLLTAVCAALPLHAVAQNDAPKPPCVPSASPARAALPARASTVPQPQQGSVAPSNKVPSEVETPSTRAMRAARARQEEQASAGSTAGTVAPDCQPAAQQAEVKPAPSRE
jgi:hypothetical protein